MRKFTYFKPAQTMKLSINIIYQRVICKLKINCIVLSHLSSNMKIQNCVQSYLSCWGLCSSVTMEWNSTLSNQGHLQYCTALHSTVLHCKVLYCPALQRKLLHWVLLYCTVLHCKILYCTTKYCTGLHITVLH